MIREKTFVTFIIIIITIDHIPDIFCCVYNLSYDPRGRFCLSASCGFYIVNIHNTTNRKSREKMERNDLILKSVLLLIQSITIPITLKLLFLLFFFTRFLKHEETNTEIRDRF